MVAVFFLFFIADFLLGVTEASLLELPAGFGGGRWKAVICFMFCWWLILVHVLVYFHDFCSLIILIYCTWVSAEWLRLRCAKILFTPTANSHRCLSYMLVVKGMTIKSPNQTCILILCFLFSSDLCSPTVKSLAVPNRTVAIMQLSTIYIHICSNQWLVTVVTWTLL